MPFVALQFYEGGGENTIAFFLVGSLSLWLIVNVAFFCTINLDYLHTFFSMKTASQYAIELFENSDDDNIKFDAVFTNRHEFTLSIHDKVKQWVANNIQRWRVEKPSWFKIEKFPDEFLPTELVEAEGPERKKRRNSVSLREIVGLDEGKIFKVHPQEDE